MRTVLVDHADHTAAVAKGEQLLAHHDDLPGLAVGLGQLLGQQHRQPEAAEQLAHRGSLTALGQEHVVLRAQHAETSERLFVALPRAWRSQGEASMQSSGRCATEGHGLM
jgi:hypothetical protein